MPTLPAALAPAGYVPFHALAFADGDEPAIAVGPAAPLPVRTMLAPAAGAALSGMAEGAQLAGPFVPELGRAIWLTLAGEWSGQVQVVRSTDGGATTRPLTMGGEPWGRYTANVNEPVAEESVAGATYYLDVALVSGALAYEVAQ